MKLFKIVYEMSILLIFGMYFQAIKSFFLVIQKNVTSECSLVINYNIYDNKRSELPPF